jgi:hypothetical protein
MIAQSHAPILLVAAEYAPTTEATDQVGPSRAPLARSSHVFNEEGLTSLPRFWRGGGGRTAPLSTNCHPLAEISVDPQDRDDRLRSSLSAGTWSARRYNPAGLVTGV